MGNDQLYSLRTMVMYMEMIFNFNAAHWQGTRLPIEYRLRSAFVAIQPMANVWRRSVLYF